VKNRSADVLVGWLNPDADEDVGVPTLHMENGI
jgi:hypothetical protein